MTMSAEPGVAEAAADGVVCWIGSSAEKVKEHQSAVHLKKGEPVEVMGTKEVENEGGQREVWLKIAPPAGETFLSIKTVRARVFERRRRSSPTSTYRSNEDLPATESTAFRQ